MRDDGSGPVVIVIPGVQGRWEWMEPALRELQRTCRVISYTLRGGAGSAAAGKAPDFDIYIEQLDEVFARTGVQRAVLCGVSYGGFIALRYAARRPERVRALVLVSAPAPGWKPNARQARYLARPRLMAPIFVLTAPARLWPELRSSLSSWRARVRFCLTHGACVLAAPLVPADAAARIAAQQATDFSGDGARVSASTLIVTGDDNLDRVVPPEVSRWYLSQIHGSRHVTLEGTGHIGMLTQPVRFAEIVSQFVHANSH
jgi:pimeloyl-ACP methyl ester carboxylesterase